MTQKKLKTSSMGKQSGKAFIFRKTVAALIKQIDK